MNQCITIKKQNFSMHPSGTLFWQERSLLMVSDVHLGKISHFRKHGAAVPHLAIQKNFDALDQAMGHYKPKSIVFLGDLFHSYMNNEWELFEEWANTQTCTMTLVAGNHDIISPLKYGDLGIAVVPELTLDRFLLTHHPEERQGYFNFAGHIHPAVRLTGIGRQSVRLRCFYKKKHQMILPAFGEFTGSLTMAITKECDVFALLGDAVLPVHIAK